jgi:hypothetical protein
MTGCWGCLLGREGFLAFGAALSLRFAIAFDRFVNLLSSFMVSLLSIFIGRK